MKTFLLWALIALIPCSTIRVICVTAPDSAAAADSEAAICAKVCVKRPAAEPPKPAPQMTCLITVDPACDLLAVDVYVLPVAPALPPPSVVAVWRASARESIGSFDRLRHTPPPKALL
jgi:hypothetical protein